MELAKTQAEADYSRPINIRRAREARGRHTVHSSRMNGQYVLANPAILAIQQLQKEFEGFAEANDLRTEDDIVALVKEVRTEGKRSDADHA